MGTGTWVVLFHGRKSNYSTMPNARIVMGTGTWVVFVYAQMPVPTAMKLF